MTVEAFEPVSEKTIAGVGPYPIGHAYLQGAIRAEVRQTGEVTIVLVDGVDYTLSPVSGDSGDLTLSAAAAAAHAGLRLRIVRHTPLEQGFSGQTARESGLEEQMDRTVMAVQENDRRFSQVISLDQVAAVPPVVPSPMHLIGFGADGALQQFPITTEVVDERLVMAFETRAEAQNPETGKTSTRNYIRIGSLVFVHDIVGTALTTGDGRRWEAEGMALPEHYAAVGDGVTDDTDALVAWAKKARGHVVLPPAKTYRHTDRTKPLVFSNDVKISGSRGQIDFSAWGLTGTRSALMKRAGTMGAEIAIDPAQTSVVPGSDQVEVTRMYAVDEGLDPVNHGLSVRSNIKLSSDDVVDEQHDAINEKRGQFAKVKHIGGRLTLAGSITTVAGETVTQAGSGATGIVVGGGAGATLRLEQVSGAFDTSGALTGSTSGALGANSVPSAIVIDQFEIFGVLHQPLTSNPKVRSVQFANFEVHDLSFVGPGRRASGEGETAIMMTTVRGGVVRGCRFFGVDYQGISRDDCVDGDTIANDFVFADKGDHDAFQAGEVISNASENCRFMHNRQHGGKHMWDLSRNPTPGITRNCLAAHNQVSGTWHAAFASHGNSAECVVSNNVGENCKYLVNPRTPGWRIEGNHLQNGESVVRLTDMPRDHYIQGNSGRDVAYVVHLPASDALIGAREVGSLTILDTVGINVANNTINIAPSMPHLTQADAAVTGGSSTTIVVGSFGTIDSVNYDADGVLVGSQIVMDYDGGGVGSTQTRTITGHSYSGGGNTLTVSGWTNNPQAGVSTYVITDTTELTGLSIRGVNSHNCAFADVYVKGAWKDAEIRALTATSDTPIAQPCLWLDGEHDRLMSGTKLFGIQRRNKSAPQFTAGVGFDWDSGIPNYGATFSGVAEIQATYVPAVVVRLRTASYDAARPYVGGATYRRVSSGDVAGYPVTAWFQSLDGAYWLLDEKRPDVHMFGAFGDMDVQIVEAGDLPGINAATYGPRRVSGTDDTQAVHDALIYAELSGVSAVSAPGHHYTRSFTRQDAVSGADTFPLPVSRYNSKCAVVVSLYDSAAGGDAETHRTIIHADRADGARAAVHGDGFTVSGWNVILNTPLSADAQVEVCVQLDAPEGVTLEIGGYLWTHYALPQMGVSISANHCGLVATNDDAMVIAQYSYNGSKPEDNGQMGIGVGSSSGYYLPVDHVEIRGVRMTAPVVRAARVLGDTPNGISFQDSDPSILTGCFGWVVDPYYAWNEDLLPSTNVESFLPYLAHWGGRYTQPGGAELINKTSYQLVKKWTPQGGELKITGVLDATRRGYEKGFELAETLGFYVHGQFTRGLKYFYWVGCGDEGGDDIAPEQAGSEVQYNRGGYFVALNAGGDQYVVYYKGGGDSKNELDPAGNFQSFNPGMSWIADGHYIHCAANTAEIIRVRECRSDHVDFGSCTLIGAEKAVYGLHGNGAWKISVENGSTGTIHIDRQKNVQLRKTATHMGDGAGDSADGIYSPGYNADNCAIHLRGATPTTTTAALAAQGADTVPVVAFGSTLDNAQPGDIVTFEFNGGADRVEARIRRTSKYDSTVLYVEDLANDVPSGATVTLDQRTTAFGSADYSSSEFGLLMEEASAEFNFDNVGGTGRHHAKLSNNSRLVVTGRVPPAHTRRISSSTSKQAFYLDPTSSITVRDARVPGNKQETSKTFLLGESGGNEAHCTMINCQIEAPDDLVTDTVQRSRISMIGCTGYDGSKDVSRLARTNTAWAPALEFTTSSTGLTQTTTGSFVYDGEFADFDVFVIVTAKGTGSGNAVIDLPASTVGTDITPITCLASNLASDGPVVAYVQSGQIKFARNLNAGQVSMNIGQFTDTTELVVRGRVRITV